MKKEILLFALCLSFISTNAQQTLAEKLGYNKNTKLLIIHADDLGVSHSENMASIKAMTNGSVNSASVMMPTPWVKEITSYAKQNTDTHDFGLHLVLTSEWENYKWGPVASKKDVPSLLDENGYFKDACSANINVEEVEIELRAQIDRAYKMGLEPTHIDSHMGCLFFSQPEVLEVYLKLGQAYRLPVLVSSMVSQELLNRYDVKVVVNEILTISEQEYAQGAENYYMKKIKELKPGLSTFLIHTAYDNHEMKGMTINHPSWGNEWRQADFDFFTSDKLKDLLIHENIQLITWREIKKALY